LIPPIPTPAAFTLQRLKMDFSGATQYTRAFYSEPQWIKALLWRNRITSVQSDGELLSMLLSQEPNLIEDWIIENHDRQGQQVWDGDDIMEAMLINDSSSNKSSNTLLRLQKLASLAMNGRLSSTFSPLELHMQMVQRAYELKNLFSDTSVNQLLKKWRHINPYKGKDILTKEAMADLEKGLKDKWLERLLSHFLKQSVEIPKLSKFGKHEDMVRECKALFGKRRWRTIKKYTSELEAILKVSPDFIPWDEPKIRDWLNRIAMDDKTTPSKLTNLWNTIRPLSHIFDFLVPDELKDLKAKMESTMDELTAVKLQQNKRATVPCLDLIKRVERLTCEHPLMTIRYYAACVRFAMATSARGNDLQHTCPSTWFITAVTRELKSWQTKTTTVHEAHKRPIPLISPLHSFMDIDWWLVMDTTIEMFSKDEKFKDIDFLFPALTKDKTGFIPRPASNAQIMDTLREELLKMVSDDEMWDITDNEGRKIRISAREAIKLFTMSSCRVLLPEWAHIADLPLELRRWLGRWKDGKNSEHMAANVYTREHRGKILQIMDRLKNKEHLLRNVGMVPEEISDNYYLTDYKPAPLMEPEDWFDQGDASPSWQLVPSLCQSPILESPRKLARCSSKESLHDDDIGEYEESAEELIRQDAEDEEWYATRTRLIQSISGTKYPASKLPEHLDGPLSLVRTKAPTGIMRVKKFHLSLTTRITVGCGMDATKCDIITGEEPLPAHAAKVSLEMAMDPRVCKRCFKFFYWDSVPDTSLLSPCEDAFTHVPLDDDVSSDSDSMASASDATAQSNDSESENEALRAPPTTSA